MISKIYKIEDEVVFYSPTLNARRTELFSGLSVGTIKAYGAMGNEIPKDDALIYLSIICDRKTGTTTVDQIYANIQLAPVVIAVVREDLLQYPGGEATFMKLAPIVSMLQVGLFFTASQAIKSVTPDEILTQERLDRWSAMLISADAIQGES